MAACYFDYRYDKIPNGLIVIGILLAACYKLLCHGQRLLQLFAGGDVGLWKGAGLQFLGVGLVLLILYLLFKPGMIGAGDVKLFCVAMIFLNSKSRFSFLILSILLAAVAAFLKIIFQKSGRERLGYFCSYVADLIRLGHFRLYWEGADFKQRKKASLHMSGPMLAGLLIHICILLNL